MNCTSCGKPVTGTPLTDPDDPLGRVYCREEHRDADAEAWSGQHYGTGVAT